MNTSRKLLLAAATMAAAAMASSAFAQSSASANGTASVNVLQPISVAVATGGSSSLNFGTIVRGAGSVAIAYADGSRSQSGDVVLVGTGGGKADFTVTGEGGQAVTISVPATISLSGPSGSTLTATLTHATLPTTLPNALGQTGTVDVSVGGSIPIAANTVNGGYSGTFTVSANYN